MVPRSPTMVIKQLKEMKSPFLVSIVPMPKKAVASGSSYYYYYYHHHHHHHHQQ